MAFQDQLCFILSMLSSSYSYYLYWMNQKENQFSLKIAPEVIQTVYENIQLWPQATNISR